MQIMKKIKKNDRAVEKIICNKCGQEIPVLHGRAAAGVCSIHQVWGYGSDKDGEVHQIDICEACYDEWMAGFAVEV